MTVSEIAASLGRCRSSIQRWIDELGIEPVRVAKRGFTRVPLYDSECVMEIRRAMLGIDRPRFRRTMFPERVR